jgi:iron-sulfur cluster assembly accessory protein
MVKITELAAQKIKEVLKKENKENAFIRLYVTGVGCDGPKFGITREKSKSEDDFLYEEYGVSILIDKKMSAHLEGPVVDYVESDNGGGFEIRAAMTDNGKDYCWGCGCSGRS